MNAFVSLPGMRAVGAAQPLAAVAPRAARPSRPAVVAPSVFLGAPVARAATLQAPVPVAAPQTKPGAAGVRMDVTVVVGENEPIESALRRFKKDVQKSGHLFELRRRRYFETATEKRIRKAAAARRKARMAKNAKRQNF